MNRCIIITSYIEGNLSDFLHPDPSDFIICADGGYDHAKQAGIIPDLLVGDFDSIEENLPKNIKAITFPAEKDDTDTGLCVKTAIASGYQHILIAGGLGGRFDHSIANLQTMIAAAEKIESISIQDQYNFATILLNGTLKIPKNEHCYLSLFSLSEVCTGVSVSGVHYPLWNHTLTNHFPLGVSNEFENEEAVISVEHGILLIILSSK